MPTALPLNIVLWSLCVPNSSLHIRTTQPAGDYLLDFAKNYLAQPFWNKLHGQSSRNTTV